MTFLLPKRVFISTEQLKEAFGVKRIGNLKALLSRNRVTYFTDVNGKPFTTKEALNSALGVGNLEVKSDDGFNIDHLKS
jgi:hypothetical protein